MQRFKNILLVHEGRPRGRRARNRAVDLAARNHARLKLVEVADPVPVSDVQYRSRDGEIDLQELLKRELEGNLAQKAAELSGGKLEVESRILFGNPFMEIMREVHHARHDLVLLTAEGDGGLKEHLFGSLSRHLLRKCPCPVWVVRPARRKKGIRVLAAVNPAETHPSARTLDRTILEMASSLARMYHGTLDIVHVWQQAPRSGRVHRNVVAKWNAELLQAAEQRVAEMLASYDFSDLKPRIHLPGGSTGLRIVEVAEERKVDVVVMGTLSRSGLKGMIMGNTTESVLQYIDASILAVKPEGFESPVKFDS
jgi:nucleotide-binding universal stress UspA family protein